MARAKAATKAAKKVAKRPASKPAPKTTRAAKPAAETTRFSTLRSRSGLYSVHPAVQMVQNWIATLKEKTGRTIDDWMKLIETEAPADRDARRAWLKKEHGLGTNSAWWMVERYEQQAAWEETPEKYLTNAEKLVDEMFAGPKAALRPIYDKLLKLGLSIARDVHACPCKTMVPLFRNYVFAQLKPTTRTRIDLGLCLRGEKPPARIIDTGGAAKNDRITHRIAITSLDEIDPFVERWLRRAYSLDA